MFKSFKMKKLNLILIFFLAAFTLQAQQELTLPDDPALADEAKRRFAISVDEMGVKRYREALKAIRWLEQNAPQLYDGLYIHGYKAYEELAAKSDSESQKNTYLDSMFYFYDKKGERFELTDREKNNRAYRYYKYWKENKERMEEGLAAYAVAYENPDDVINNNIVSYMDMVRRYKAYGNSISNEKVLDIYSKVMDVISIKREQGEDETKLERYSSAINGLLTMTIGDDLNCEFINKNLAPPLDQGDDLQLAKKVFGLLLGQSCSDSPYFLKAALIIQKNEPTSGLAKAIAQQYYKKKDLDNASAFYLEAINFEEDQAKKGALYLDMAKLYAAQGLKVEARQFARDAANTDPGSTSQAYTFIGNMYMSSFDDCKKSQSQIDDRAVFMAAYDMFQKAGDQYGMTQAKGQFPTVSEVFTANKKEGDAIKVGCWINATTTIRTRPSE